MTTIEQSTWKVQSQLQHGLADLVGNTPMLALKHIGASLPFGVSVHAKAEWFSPGGSIKDRPALQIIREALADGQLTAEKRLLDATSGNTGIAFATFGASMGIPVTLTMPANASSERTKILKALGAELILTDPLEGTDGAILAARKMAEMQPETYFYANQYDNPANWRAHYQTTGPEIWSQTARQITHFIAGLGTSGTLMGAGKYLREVNPFVKIIGVQPAGPFHGLEGLKHMPTAIKPKLYDPDFPDQIVEVKTEAAYETVSRLARKEGLFVGISSGAALVAALQVASRLRQGVVVTIFPDAGYKYLSDQALWQPGK